MTVPRAQAADLLVKAAPVEYVKVCSLYGAGFFYIPGTDTCLKIGGYLRADHIYGMGNAGGYYMGTPSAQATRTTCTPAGTAPIPVPKVVPPVATAAPADDAWAAPGTLV